MNLCILFMYAEAHYILPNEKCQYPQAPVNPQPVILRSPTTKNLFTLYPPSPLKEKGDKKLYRVGSAPFDKIIPPILSKNNGKRLLRGGSAPSLIFPPFPL